MLGLLREDGELDESEENTITKEDSNLTGEVENQNAHYLAKLTETKPNGVKQNGAKLKQQLARSRDARTTPGHLISTRASSRKQ